MSAKVSTADPHASRGTGGTRKPLIEVPAVGAAAKVVHTSAAAVPPAPVERVPETARPIAVPKTSKKPAIPRQPSRFKSAVGGVFSRMRGAISATRPLRSIPSKLWVMAAFLTCISAGALTYTLMWPSENSLQMADVDEIDDFASPTSEIAASPAVNPAPVVSPAPAVMADARPQPALPVPVDLTIAPAGPALTATSPAPLPPAPVEPAGFQPGAKQHVVGVWLEGTIEEIPDASVQSAAYDASQSRPR